MTTPSSELSSRRLDLAGTRDFAVAGAGPARRAALGAFNRRWLAGIWASATGWGRIGGIALALKATLGWRVPEDVEIAGIDGSEHAESAYDINSRGGRMSGGPSAAPTGAPAKNLEGAQA